MFLLAACRGCRFPLIILLRVILLCVVALEADATPAVRQWRFDVTADGLPIGTHEYALHENDGTRSVQSEMHFSVRLLVIDAYRYEHHATETWQNDCLSRLDTHTEEKGRVTTVTGHVEANRFEVEGVAGARGSAVLRDDVCLLEPPGARAIASAQSPDRALDAGDDTTARP